MALSSTLRLDSKAEVIPLGFLNHLGLSVKENIISEGSKNGLLGDIFDFVVSSSGPPLP